MDANAQQAARNQTYITFYGEDETDYTAGPIRIVDAFDGVQAGGALLLNLDLSAKIRAAILAQRALEVVEENATEERMELLMLALDINPAINRQELEIAIAEENGADDVPALRQKLKLLEFCLQDVNRRMSAIERRLQDQAQGLRLCQAEVNTYLEEAFVAASLVEPAEETTPSAAPLDMDVEFEKFVHRQDKVDNQPVDMGDTLHSNCDFQQPQIASAPEPEPEPVELDPEQRTKLDATDRFCDARQALLDAQAAFDGREHDRDDERQHTDEATEAFDLRWVQRGRDLTRALIEAEAAYAEVKITAIAAGVEFNFNGRTSNFQDQPDDGYRESFENGEIASCPTSKVLSWLEGVPEGIEPRHHEPTPVYEGIEWDAEVDISDSRSLVAECSSRRKIDSWQRICGV